MASQYNNQPKFDSLLPPEMAAKAENIGVGKAHMDVLSMLLLSMLAGAFIAMAAEFYTVVVTGSGAMPYGVTKLLGGLAFSLGLILVVIAGAELFTGNNLIVMALASRRIGWGLLLRNWVLVYVGNFIGATGTAALMFATGQFTFAGGAVGETALAIAEAKCRLDFWPALALGVYCNALVCLAVWLCFSARSATDKILCIVFPITAFVASGFEHSVANMYFIPMGLILKSAAGVGGHPELTTGNFLLANLLPVTIGNILGGAGFVGVTYWIIYSRRNLTDKKVLKQLPDKGVAWQTADAVEEAVEATESSSTE